MKTYTLFYLLHASCETCEFFLTVLFNETPTTSLYIHEPAKGEINKSEVKHEISLCFLFMFHTEFTAFLESGLFTA